MSMIRCDDCEGIFDSDADPGCFVETPKGDQVFCEPCREDIALIASANWRRMNGMDEP